MAELEKKHNAAIHEQDWDRFIQGMGAKAE